MYKIFKNLLEQLVKFYRHILYSKMGIKLSKDNKHNNVTNQKVSIADLSIVKVPADYTMIKISSFYVNLQNTISIESKAKEIIYYIFTKYKNKVIDIANIEGFNDNQSLNIFIKMLHLYVLKNNIKIYVAPLFKEFSGSESNTSHVGIVSSDIAFDTTFNLSTERTGGEEKNKKIIRNIIISRYPIDDYVFEELDKETDMDDIIGIQTILGVCITVHERHLFVFTTTLSHDVQGIDNKKVRESELKEVVDIIKGYIHKMKKRDKKYRKAVCILCGMFNIDELYGNTMYCEYVQMIQNHNFLDIYRYISPDNDFGYTTRTKERLNYIFLYFPSKLCRTNTSKLNLETSLENVCDNIPTNVTELLNIIFKTYKIHFIDFYVVKPFEDSIYYPIELVFMMKNKY